MSEPVSEQQPAGAEYGTEEWTDTRFPDRGEAPSNDVVVNPNAERAPNAGDHG